MLNIHVIRELQIDTVRYCYTHYGQKSRTLKTPNSGEDMEQWEFSFTAGWNAKWCRHFGRQFGDLL